MKSVILKFFYCFIFILTFTFQAYSAEDRMYRCYRYDNANVPYGYYRHHWRKTGYGQRTQIKNVEDAIALVREFYAPHNVQIIPVLESLRFYRMEVLDEKSNIIDVIVVDKLSGRLRSIY